MAAICHDSHAAQALRALQRPSRPNSEGISWGIRKTENNEFLEVFRKKKLFHLDGGDDHLYISSYLYLLTFDFEEIHESNFKKCMEAP